MANDVVGLHGSGATPRNKNKASGRRTMAAKGAELAALVGPDHVSEDPVLLDRLARDASLAPPIRPQFVVRPANADEVRGMIRWAIETRTPLVPVSSGSPHQYGDTVPSRAEVVIVDLSRLNRILKIDRRNRVAVIEPGVTYADLIPALAKEGLKLSHPLQPRANKSVVTSLLERQPTLIPRVNYSLPEPLRTCGVVWGNGEVAFTGEAGNGPLSLDEQWARGMAQLAAWGPNATDLMRIVTGAQGTMGIVVWASVKLDLVPSVRKFFAVPADDVVELTDILYKLTKVGLGDEVLIVNRRRLAELSGLNGGRLQALPEWTLLVGLAGAALLPQERLAVQEKELGALARTSAMTLCDSLKGVSQADFTAIVDGFRRPDEAPHQDIFFLSTLDKVAGFVATMQSVATKHGYPVTDIGIYVQPQHQGVSHHIEFRLPYDASDRAAAAKVERVYREASEALIEDGAYFSRPYGYWSDLIYQRDHTSTEILRTVKGILDPTNILNPGKLCF
jgi:FAD/FMN-containing dehydrogenase